MPTMGETAFRAKALPATADRTCMNDLLLVRKNLFRKKLRAGLMIVAILIAFAIFGVLAGFYHAFNWRQDQAADRLVVANKINFTLPLPFAYYNRVRAIEGVRQATYASWFGGYYQIPGTSWWRWRSIRKRISTSSVMVRASRTGPPGIPQRAHGRRRGRGSGAQTRLEGR